ATVTGSDFITGDTVVISMEGPSFTTSINYTLIANDDAVDIATGLVSAINLDADLIAAGITAANGGGTLSTITVTADCDDADDTIMVASVRSSALYIRHRHRSSNLTTVT